MKPYTLPAAMTVALLLVGCGTTGDKQAVSAKSTANSAANLDNAVATVNGKPISKNALRSLVAEISKQSGEENVPEDKAVDYLINHELLRQEAELLHLTNTPEVTGQLENVTRDAIAQLAVDKYRKGIVVTDEQARREYDTQIAGANFTEFKARHILVETEQEAKDILAKLKKGAKFTDLAKNLSKDPQAKQNGGDLGWFNPQQMVPEFTQAVAGLKNGETAPEPVKTQFGWHVIHRESSRKQEPKPFDAVKEQIKTVLIGQKIQAYVDSLRKEAKVENFVSSKK
jgi:peptidyl-prolyl cis-trans isomerase C